MCKARPPAIEARRRYLARDLGPAGIRVNLVAAGPLRTRAAAGIARFDLLGRGLGVDRPARLGSDRRQPDRRCRLLPALGCVASDHGRGDPRRQRLPRHGGSAGLIGARRRPAVGQRQPRGHRSCLLADDQRPPRCDPGQRDARTATEEREQEGHRRRHGKQRPVAADSLGQLRGVRLVTAPWTAPPLRSALAEVRGAGLLADSRRLRARHPRTGRTVRISRNKGKVGTVPRPMIRRSSWKDPGPFIAVESISSHVPSFPVTTRIRLPAASSTSRRKRPSALNSSPTSPAESPSTDRSPQEVRTPISRSWTCATVDSVTGSAGCPHSPVPAPGAGREPGRVRSRVRSGRRSPVSTSWSDDGASKNVGEVMTVPLPSRLQLIW